MPDRTGDNFRGLDRREFARTITAGCTGGVIALTTAGPVSAQAPPESAPSRPPSLTTLQLAQVITMCPGAHWDEATVEAVLNDIRGDQARSRQLSAFGLKNADEPATVFPPRTLRAGQGSGQ